MSNKNTYNEIDVVELYARETHLYRPEETILNFLIGSLLDMKMLDMGVGGGRTTLHFAKLVKEYVGIDYSEKMIIKCKKRFSGYPNNISFKVCDARSMEMFEDNTFDFILFSFNGIDYISHNDRLKALREIQRVGKHGGYFCFSTHNLETIHKIFKFKHQLCLSPERLVRRIVKWLLLRFVYNKHTNIKKLKSSKYAIINDGAHEFRLQTYYISPTEQIEQLSEWFRDVQVYSVTSGSEINGEIELNSIDDEWLCYLCVIK